MQVLKEEVRQQILSAATDVFLKKSYTYASMNLIASFSGVSTSNIYNYFSGKRTLFSAVVEPVARKIKGELLHAMQHKEASRDELLKEIEALVPVLTHIVIENHKEMVLLFDRSAGSGYEDFGDQLVEMIRNHFKTTMALESEKMEDLFLHIVANNIVEGILEIARHYRNQETTARMIRHLMAYHVDGIKIFL